MRFGGYRRWGGIALVTGIGVVLGSAGGCTANQQTELVPGVVSQIQVPRTMKAIRVDVQPQGQQSTCFIRSVDPNTGGATLPRTLGIVPSGDVSRLVTVTVTGYEISDSDPMAPQALQDCLTSPFNNGKYDASVKILRRTRQPYVDGRILFLPMPLRYACWEGEQCMDTETCVAGKCQDALTDPHKLVDFDP